MKVNFNAITLKDIEGNEQKVAIAAELGNMMYMRGQDIEECELGRTIYMDGKVNRETDLTDAQVGLVKKYIGGYSYIMRNAIEEAMK